uniref:melanoma-associated antigen B4-like n=1 Tax=Jaculus jaculus TaxID=51337 RepID=UPI001E1B4A45|nr:melanoma-associated antigen B4-like [Jaculus jaculus]XP_044996464.1 melanoma-associated antigen B4-like [Jaculus jaculus]
MPRGHKNKGRSRAKHHQAHAQIECVQGAEPSAEVEAVSPPVGHDDLAMSLSACTLQGAASPGSPDAASDVGAEGTIVGAKEEGSSASQAAGSPQPTGKNSISRKASMLLHFLLEKYEQEEPIKHADMAKLIGRKYLTHFPDILRRATEQMEFIYGLELKQANPSSLSYSLVSKLGLSPGENLRSRKDLSKKGLLMMLLGVVLLNGNRATEHQVWKFLNLLGLYAGQRHPIFGEPRKIITKDLVEESYLEYHLVPGSVPPCYEFLWGPRAYVETTKLTVLEALAKMNDTTPDAYPILYEQALKEKAERAGKKGESGDGSGARAIGHAS